MDPKRITFDAEPGQAMPRLNHCGGAVLRVDRDTYFEYRRGGVVWSTKPAEVFALGPTGSARVRCDSESETDPKLGQRYTYGVCRSCAELELRHRRAMRELAK